MLIVQKPHLLVHTVNNFSSVTNYQMHECLCIWGPYVRLHPCQICYYTPPHKKWRGIMLYPPNFECPSARPPVRPSVSASFPCSNFHTFWPTFFKLCIDIGIGEEWNGIASGLISFWNNKSYGPWCMSKMLCASFPYSNFSTFLPIFFKLCIGIGIGQEWYGIASGIILFRNNRVMALDLCPKCIFGQYLKN